VISEDVQAYSKTLTELGLGHHIVEHPELKTPPETQAYLGLGMDEGISTMIMKTGNGFVAIIRRDDCRIDFKKVKQLVSKNIRMATPEEFTNLTGQPLGAARVYNPGLATYIDEKVFEPEVATGGSGSFTCSIRYNTADLKKIPNSQVVQISQDPSTD